MDEVTLACLARMNYTGEFRPLLTSIRQAQADAWSGLQHTPDFLRDVTRGVIQGVCTVVNGLDTVFSNRVRRTIGESGGSSHSTLLTYSKFYATRLEATLLRSALWARTGGVLPRILLGVFFNSH